MTYEKPQLPLEEQAEVDKLHYAQVVILDDGSEFSEEIERAVSDLGVHCEVLPIDTPADTLSGRKAIFITGESEKIFDSTTRLTDPKIWYLGIPILGTSYGMQIMTHQLGGTMSDKNEPIDGAIKTVLFGEPTLFKGIPSTLQNVWLKHNNSLQTPPRGFDVIGGHEDTITAIADKRRKLYGLQFQPELGSSHYGTQIVANFLFEISNVEQDNMVDNYPTELGIANDE